MSALVLLLYLAFLAFRCGLQVLNVRHLREHGEQVPPGFEGIVDPGDLARASAYTVARGRLALARSLFDGGVTLLFLFGGLLAWYDGLMTGLGLGFIAGGLAFFLLLSLARALLEVPFDLYDHFRVEERFGFNRMGPGLWAADHLKGLLLSTLFLGLLVSAALWLVRAAPGTWWLWVWMLLVAFGLLVTVISPYLIEPLFFRFEPLEAEGLEEEIRGMMGKVGLSVSRVLQVDASRRSGHSNAYFTGLGRQKRVVLFDTLVEQLAKGEILAVLAHELGHLKGRHIVRRMAGMAGAALLFCWLAWVLIRWPGLPGLIGLEEASFYARAVIVFFLLGLLAFPLAPLFNALSRRQEREADRFACHLHGDPGDLASALARMSRENLANLHPHPLYARFHYSHPPVAERVVELRNKAA